MIEIKNWFLPISKARCGKKLRAFSGVTIHETANTLKTATAKSHATYLNINGGKNKEISYHYVVDDEEVYHIIPDDEVAWHAGDGANGKGNNETIAIEICVNNGGDFLQAVKNAAYLTAALLHERGIKNASSFIFEHNHFSSYGKNCPANLRAGVAGGMPFFMNKTQFYLDEMYSANANSEAPNKRIYTVQVGAFASENAAKAYSNKVKKAGFENFVTCCERS